jgi:hypothetical protein
MTGYPIASGWVAPFGNQRIKGYLPLPVGLSQLITSFFASESLGILRTPLVTFFSRLFVSYYYFLFVSLVIDSCVQHVKEL